jgi:large subunit ribosomal protein L22
MHMKGYSVDFDRENFASARLEGVDASYKDLSEVCGRIRRKSASWAMAFLEKAAAGEIPVLYKRHNKRLGHRRELGGRKGRYPEKAAGVVLGVLESAMANGMAKGLGEGYTVFSAAANKRFTYPRMAPKGRTARSYYELARVEIVLKPSAEAQKAGARKAQVKKPDEKAASGAKKSEEKAPAAKAPEEKNASEAPKHEAHPHVHKHGDEKEKESAHAHRAKYEYEHARAKRTEVK